MRRIIRLTALLLCLLLAAGAARADLAWPAQRTAGQEQLRLFVEQANAELTAQGERPINSLFECWPGLAVLGITAADGAEIPEDVEITVTLSQDSVDRLELRVSDSRRFPIIAASLIRAASGGVMTAQEALREPKLYAARVQKDPEDSFADPVLTDKGDTPRTYWAYYPNQYGNGVNWLVLTLIFGREDAGAVKTTPLPEAEERTSSDDSYDYWSGYGFPAATEGMEQFSITVTPTPEPDSAVYPY